MRILFILLFSIIFNTAFSQSLAWVDHLDGSGDHTNVIALDVDTRNSTYFTGYIDGPGLTITTPYAVSNFSLPDDHCGFVARVTPSGALNWRIFFGDFASNNSSSEGYAITIDEPNSCFYVAGKYTGNVDFDPSSGVAYPTGGSGVDDGFIAKYRLNGTFVWVIGIGNSADYYGGESVGAVTYDDAGNIYCSGNFDGFVDFDPFGTNIKQSTSVYNDVFVAKYDPDGQLLWVDAISPTTQNDALYSSGIDYRNTDKRLYATVFGGNEYDVDPSAAITLEHIPSSIIQFYGVNGNYVNHFSAHGTMTNMDYDPFTDEVFVVGYQEQESVYCFKLSYDLDYVWVNHMLGNYSYVYDVSCDDYKNFWIVGETNGDGIDMDPSFLGVHHIDDGAFIGNYYKDDGSLMCAFGYDGPGLDDGSCNTVKVCPEEYDIVIGGIFKGTVDFNSSDTQVQNLVATDMDGVVAKYNDCKHGIHNSSHFNEQKELLEKNNTLTVIQTTDLSGRSVGKNYTGMVIEIMSDGSRRMIFKQNY